MVYYILMFAGLLLNSSVSSMLQTITTTTIAPQQGQKIEWVVFNNNGKNIATIHAGTARLFSPVINNAIKYKAQSAENFININVPVSHDREYSDASVKAFSNLLKMIKLDSVPNHVDLLNFVENPLSQDDLFLIKKTITGDIHKLISTTITNPELFFELLSLIEYYNVKPLARIVAEHLPQFWTKHINDPESQKITLDYIPEIVKKAFLETIHQNSRYKDMILTHNYHYIAMGNEYSAIEWLDINPNGKTVVVGFTGGAVKLLTVATKTIKEVYPANATRSAFKVAFSHDGNYWASGFSDGIVNVVNSQTGKTVHTVSLSESVTGLAFSPDGNYFACSSRNAEVKLLNLNNNQMVSPATVGLWVTCLAFSPDSKYLAYGSRDGKVQVLDCNSKDVTNVINFNSWVSCLVFSPDSRYLALGSEGGEVKRVKLEDMVVTDVYNNPANVTNNYAKHLAFSPDGTTLKVAFLDRTISSFNLAGNTPVHTPNFMTFVPSINQMVFRPNTTQLVTTDGVRRVQFLDINTNESKNFYAQHEPYYIAFSNDGNSLALNHRRNTIEVIQFGMAGISSFEHAFVIALLEELKMSKSLANLSADSFIRHIVKDMPLHLQKSVYDRYGITGLTSTK